MTALAADLAYAKVNLCLLVGPARADGRHELVTVFDSLDLVDALDVELARGDRDEVVCEGVSGPNLVEEALRALRGAGWAAPPVRVSIRKRIPVAAGLGGGSADAAAMLRLAPRLAAVDAATQAAIAQRLGADVPAQLQPGPSLGTGAGEAVTPLPGLPPYGVLLLRQPFGLSTAAVYREADRLGARRPMADLQMRLAELSAALPTALPDHLLVNDLQPAALSLAPALEDVLAQAREAGADHAMVCGSGPTVIGLFLGADGPGRARAAAASISMTGALAAVPIGRGGSAWGPDIL